MKIVYFGGDMFYSNAEYLVKQSEHEVIRIYTGERNEEDKTITRHIRKLAADHKISTQEGKPTTEDIETLKDLECEMILVCGYGHKIPDWSGGTIKYGVNMHPSLLPIGAGAMSMPQAFLKGVTETGLTLHKLAPDWDTGDIILQESISMSDVQNYEELLRWNQKTAVTLLKKFLKDSQNLWDGATPQDMNKFDYWKIPTEQEAIVDYTTDPVETVAAKLRYHRFANEDGHVEYIKNITVTSDDHGHPNGTLISQEGDTYTVACKGGIIRFTSVLDTNPRP